MIRVLLVLLAGLIAVLAFVLDRPLLYAAAGVSLATALILVGRRLWTAYQNRRPRSDRSSPERSESLQDLGIMEVRPQSSDDASASGTAPSDASTDTAASTDASSSAPASSGTASPAARESDRSDRASASPSGDGGTHPAVSSPTSASSRTGETAAAQHDSAQHDSAQHDSAQHDSAPSDSAPPESEEDGADAKSVGAKSVGAESVDAETVDAETVDAETVDAETEADEEVDEEAGEEAQTDEPAAPVGADRRRNGVTTTDVEEAPVLAPYIEAVRAALGAHTVCLLVQEDVVLDYEIRAIASAETDVRRSGSFSTQDPLLTATMTRQSVTIRPLDGEGAVAEFLKYYRSDVDIDHVALAPIRRPDEPSTYFLLADAAPGTDLDTTRARTLMEHFSQTLALILEAEETDPVSAMDFSRDAGRNGGTATTTASEAAAAERRHAASHGNDDHSPRPRSEIIAEEMEAADEESEPLALVLIHLNRAESLAEEGEEAVAAAEQKLRKRLEDAAPGSRVTRFGELTYGVFFRGDVDAVEPWAADLQRELDEETGTLEGGASIGVAMRSSRHTGEPESLRTDATQALREAYESGAATIIE